MINKIKFLNYFYLIILFIVTSANAQYFYPHEGSSHLKVFINDGKIESGSSKEIKIKNEIKEMLKFSIGFYNFYESATNLQEIDIQIINRQEKFITFKANFTVFWNNKYELKLKNDLILPRWGERDKLKKIFNLFQDRKNDFRQNCLALDEDSLLLFSELHYYYRPQNKNCSISKFESTLIQSLFQKIEAKTEIIKKSTDDLNKFNWMENWNQKKKHSVLFIFGREKIGGNLSQDQGYLAYQRQFYDLIKMFNVSNLKHTNVDDLNRIDGKTKIYLEFNDSDQKYNIEFNLYFISSVTDMSTSLQKSLEEQMKNADLIFYSGHSELGDAISFFQDQKNSQSISQNQLIVIDSCISASYFRGSSKIKNDLGYISQNYYQNYLLTLIPSYYSNSIYINRIILNHLFLLNNPSINQILSEINLILPMILAGEKNEI